MRLKQRGGVTEQFERASPVGDLQDGLAIGAQDIIVPDLDQRVDAHFQNPRMTCVQPLTPYCGNRSSREGAAAYVVDEFLTGQNQSIDSNGLSAKTHYQNRIVMPTWLAAKPRRL